MRKQNFLIGIVASLIILSGCSGFNQNEPPQNEAPPAETAVGTIVETVTGKVTDTAGSVSEAIGTSSPPTPTRLPTASPTPIEPPAVPATQSLPTATPEVNTEMSDPEPPAEDEATPVAETKSGYVIPGNPDLDYAQVIFVKATQSSDGSWRFDTTVRHDDQSWDDYADAWQVIDPETEAIIAERILLHPHDNEQPFTRSESNIVIPDDLTQVIVRAKDNVEGFGGRQIIVDLSVEKTEVFEVVRAN